MITRAEIESVLAAGASLDVHRPAAHLRRGARRAVTLAVVMAAIAALMVAVIVTRAAPIPTVVCAALIGAALAIGVDLISETRSRLVALRRIEACPVCLLDWHALRAAAARMWWCGGMSRESHAADRIDDARAVGGA